MVTRNVWAEIDLGAIVHNLKIARSKLSEGVKLCAVVKANAYGHGAVAVAKTAVSAGADYLAVALTQEGQELREAGIKAPILILGAMPEGHGEAVVALDLEQAVHSIETARELSGAAVKLGKTVKIHMAVETGMNRIGCFPCEAGELAKSITSLPGITLVGMFSHFSKADEADKSFALKQFARFEEATARVRAAGITIPLQHIANSAAIAELPQSQLSMVRQGITLYGLWPSEVVGLSQKDELWPALRLKARVVHVKTLAAGEAVGYGGTFVAAGTTRIATLPLGYADGLSRKLSNKGCVIIRGQKAPIVGRVCMDQVMVDVTRIADTAVGDEVLVFGGKEISLDTVAAWMDTISYEAACLISARVPRIFINEPAN